MLQKENGVLLWVNIVISTMKVINWRNACFTATRISLATMPGKNGRQINIGLQGFTSSESFNLPQYCLPH